MAEGIGEDPEEPEEWKQKVRVRGYVDVCVR